MIVSISSAITASTLHKWMIGKCPHSSPFHQARRKSATFHDAPVSAARVGGMAMASKRPIAAPASSKLTCRMTGRRCGGVVAEVPGIISVTRFRSEEHTSELQSLMRISYAVFCLKKKKNLYTYQVEK